MVDQTTQEQTPDLQTTSQDGGVAVDDELTTSQIAERARSVNIRADLFDEEEYDLEEYEALLEMYENTLTNIEEGEIVKARVLRVTDKSVILDVGFKSEGSVNRDEFKDPDALQPGDELIFTLTDGTRHVYVLDEISIVAPTDVWVTDDKGIVFINERMERTRDGSGYAKAVRKRVQGASIAANLGAVALVIRSVGTSDERFAHTGTMRYDVNAPRIPAFSVSNPDADLLSRQLKTNKQARLRLKSTARDLPHSWRPGCPATPPVTRCSR